MTSFNLSILRWLTTQPDYPITSALVTPTLCLAAAMPIIRHRHCTWPRIRSRCHQLIVYWKRLVRCRGRGKGIEARFEAQVRSGEKGFEADGPSPVAAGETLYVYNQFASEINKISAKYENIFHLSMSSKSRQCMSPRREKASNPRPL